MNIEITPLQDLHVLTPDCHADQRGFFMETFREDALKALGLKEQFVLDSHSHSVKNVVRGLHFQWDPPMNKIMRVVRGTAFVAAVDLRRSSSTFLRWHGVELSEDNRQQLYVPSGFAVGFCALSQDVDMLYKQSSLHNSLGASGILWCDGKIGIDWPVKNPILSAKDKAAQTLDEWLLSPESDKLF